MELENILGTKTDVNFTNATSNACISIPSGPEDISRSRNCKPVQPILERVPKHKDGDRFRSFNSKLYHFKWLEYSVSQDSVFCYYCRHFSENGSISDYKCDTFIVTGYRQWKKCYGKSEKENRLLKHQLSFSHCKAVANYEAYNSTLEKGSVISQISKEHAMLIKENRHYLVTLCEILLTIAQQKIGVRESGSLFRASAIDIESESIDYGSHSGNFLSLLALVGNHDEVIARRIRHGPGNAKYTHHSVQNALLDIMADEVKNKIFEEMQAAEYFAILADETKDLSKKEQLSIAVRYLYDGNIHEEFLCIEELETLDAEGLSSKIINVMKDRVNFQNCIGQAYDGASVVSGKHAGVNAIIKDRVAPLANYIHCFNHRLNLVLVDVATSIQCVRDCLSLLQKLYVFSPELDYSDALELLEVLQERLNDCRTDTTMQNLWSQAANVCHDLGMHDFGRKLRYAERNRETPTACETISKLSEKFYSGLSCAKGET
ncbi:Zinc finger MYM-type protein 1, partial [Araneus ventricosus]